MNIETIKNNILKKAYNFNGKMPAKLQREIFGKVIFGRKTIKIDTFQWSIKIVQMVAFGQDSNVWNVKIERILDWSV